MVSVVGIIAGCAILALIVAAFYAVKVNSLKLTAADIGASEDVVIRLREISDAIAEGAMAFLSQEYKFVGIFAVAFAVVIALALDNPATVGVNEGVYSAAAFIIGAAISSVW